MCIYLFVRLTKKNLLLRASPFPSQPSCLYNVRPIRLYWSDKEERFAIKVFNCAAYNWWIGSSTFKAHLHLVTSISALYETMIERCNKYGIVAVFVDSDIDQWTDWCVLIRFEAFISNNCLFSMSTKKLMYRPNVCFTCGHHRNTVENKIFVRNSHRCYPFSCCSFGLRYRK